MEPWWSDQVFSHQTSEQLKAASCCTPQAEYWLAAHFNVYFRELSLDASFAATFRLHPSQSYQEDLSVIDSDGAAVREAGTAHLSPGSLSSGSHPACLLASNAQRRRPCVSRCSHANICKPQWKSIAERRNSSKPASVHEGLFYRGRVGDMKTPSQVLWGGLASCLVLASIELLDEVKFYSDYQ